MKGKEYQSPDQINVKLGDKIEMSHQKAMSALWKLYFPLDNVILCETIQEAHSSIQTDIVVITGSLHLVGGFLSILNRK